jgi:hypothetical protein
MQYKEVAVGSTVYFWFAANLTTGAAGDGATPLYDVRAAGGGASDAPTASGTPTLLTHANYTDGLHEIAIDTTGYNAGEYAVFCTLTISSVNPAGFVGSFLVVAASSTSRDLLAAIKTKTDNLPSDPADASVIAGRFDTLDTSIGDLPTNAELATALGTADDAVLTAIGDLPTNAELATALGTADDATLAAIAALNNLSQADIRTAVGLGSANLDTQLGDLPTNTELATALAAADDAVLAALALVKAVTDQLAQSVKTLVEGTADAGSSETSIIAKTLSPASAVNDQFNGRIMIFTEDTATAALRGQATEITDFVHATQAFTVTALTTAPAEDDVFVIV